MDEGALAGTLRGWRDRLTPAEVGLPGGLRRRSPGLRREELALLAGVSADYLTRLEQGRAAAPSRQVVGALARALRLSTEEADHLHLLAGLAPPVGGTSRHLTPGVQRLLDRLADTPVAVFDAGWHLLAANQVWAAAFGDPTGWEGRGRNVIWRHFTGAPTRVEQTPEQATAFSAALVADLRVVTGLHPDDAELQQLVAALRASSAHFRSLWEAGAHGAHTSSRKVLVHPAVGRVELDCDVLTVAGSDLHVVAYTAAPGTADAARLELLAVLGTQEMPGAADTLSEAPSAAHRPAG